MTNEILSVLNEIKLYHKFEVALKLSPEVTIHKKESIAANDHKSLFEYAVTDYDFSTQNMIVNTDIGISSGLSSNLYLVWSRDFTPASTIQRPAEQKIDYSIGSISSPYKFMPYIPCFSNHKMVAYNETGQAATVEIILHSFIFPKYLWIASVDRFFKKDVVIF